MRFHPLCSSGLSVVTRFTTPLATLRVRKSMTAVLRVLARPMMTVDENWGMRLLG